MPQSLSTLLSRRLPLIVFALLPGVASADCRDLFTEATPYVFEGVTSPGIKNDFVEQIRLVLMPDKFQQDRVTFAEGTLQASRLPGGRVEWNSDSTSTHRWGNQCLTVTTETGVQAFLALSWDPNYRHPNVHGVLARDDGEWVFRGFLDNVTQQFHEAAVELRLTQAR